MIKISKKIFFCLVFVVVGANAKIGVVDKIVDGDTIKLKNGTSCRFAYIDTPESSMNQRLLRKINSCKNKIDITDFQMINSGSISKEYLKSKISVNDEIEYKIISKDQYKREICEIYFKGENINLDIVRNGFAYPYYKYINNQKEKVKYYNANKEAILNKKGLYLNNSSTMECLSLIDN